MGMKASKRPIRAVATWVRRQPPKMKGLLAVVSAMSTLIFLRLIIHDHDNLFVASETVHAIGICLLIYKLTKEKTCAGLSLKSQELTAMFLAARLYCSLVMEYDIHTILDSASLATTLWVIYMIRYKLKSTYLDDKDNLPTYYVAVPCVVLAILVHPSTLHYLLHRILWAFCVYLEAVSVLPQLRAMQNTKIVEPYTAHYVFALGIARFLSCAHWVLQVYSNIKYLLHYFCTLFCCVQFLMNISSITSILYHIQITKLVLFVAPVLPLWFHGYCRVRLLRIGRGSPFLIVMIVGSLVHKELCSLRNRFA